MCDVLCRSQLCRAAAPVATTPLPLSPLSCSHPAATHTNNYHTIGDILNIINMCSSSVITDSDMVSISSMCGLV